MKKAFFLLSFLAAGAAEAGAQPAPAKKVLVAYYSYSGNTRQVARQIAEATGGDLFEIVPAAAYPADYDAVVAQAKKEIAEGYKPALKGLPKDVSAYDVVFVGSPCWWYTIAPPVATMLAGSDLKGKTVVPFMTHEGSGMGHSEDDIRRLCPASTVVKGLPVRGRNAARSQEAVVEWLRKINLVK